MAELSAGLVKLTQSINVGQVSVPVNTATKILSANANRKSVKLSRASATSGAYLGTTSSVSDTTGFVFTETVLELDWQTEIWVYSGTAFPMSFAEESVS